MQGSMKYDEKDGINCVFLCENPKNAKFDIINYAGQEG